MLKIEKLTGFQQDVLKEIGNIGAGNAATALSQLLSTKVEMTVPDVSIVPLQSAGEVLGNPEVLTVAIYTQFFGDITGKILVLFAQEEAVYLADMVFDRSVGSSHQLGEMEKSALQEVVNIMAGAYLDAVIRLTDLNLLPSVPAYACDMAGAIINTALSDLGAIGDFAVLIETQFTITQRRLQGHFFLVPDPGALDKLLSVLGVGTKWKS